MTVWQNAPDKYPKPYWKLKPNECLHCIARLSKEIMAACVDTSCLAQEDHEKYLLNSKEVAVYVLNILDGIRYFL